MSIIKVQVSDDYIVQHGGVPAIDTPFVTDQGEQGVVTMSFPETGDPNILVQVPDHISPLDLASQRQVVDAREQHSDYGVLWLNPRVLDAGPDKEGKWRSLEFDVKFAPGDTFDMCGATDAVQKAANYGAGVFACCVDTGVDDTHEVFAGKDLVMWSNGAFGSATDQHGHGTFCLSEIGGMYGMAPDAKIGMFQGLPGAGGNGTEQTVSAAIRAAADYIASQGFKFAVVSMSLGGSHSSVIQAATAYLLQLPNVVVCCAAGNSGPNADIGSPADTSGAIVVGSCNRDLVLSDFSSGGAKDARIWNYHVGEKVIGAQRGGGYMSSDGTSMATPEVAGECTLHGAKGRSAAETKALMTTARQAQLSPPTTNGKGFQQLLESDFITADAPPVDPPADPPDGEDPPVDETPAGPVQTIIGNLTEARFQMDRVRFDSTAPNQALQSVMGIAAEYIDQSLAIVATLDPNQPPPGNGSGGGGGPILPGPLPTPLPATPGAFTKKYGAGAREYFNLVIPQNAVDLPICILWHGGGWLTGDPNTAIPLSNEHEEWALDYLKPLLERYKIDTTHRTVEELVSEAYTLHVLEVSRWFVQQGMVLATPAYNYGVGPAIQDAYNAVGYIVEHALEYGANPKRLILSGHSAGGHLAMMCAANPNLPMPASVVTLAGAGLYLTGQNDGVPAKSASIFAQAWGAPSQWPQYSPHTHVNDRTPHPQNVTVIQGSADDQLNPNWAVNYVTVAKRAGWGCDLNMQQGGDHFSVANPAFNQTTASILLRALAVAKGVQ